MNGTEVGKFAAVSAVIPSEVKVSNRSVQGIIGKEVTLSAEVTVPAGQSKAGIPVTFNITSATGSTVNSKIEVVAYTNENGVATHSYTRYYSHNDNVTAYATDKSSVYSTAAVYWANKTQLAVTELTAGNDLANNTKKSYKVNGAASTTYYVAIKENINVAPDKVVNAYVQDHGTSTFVTPYELTTGGTKFATVRTNADGEASFTVYGSNLSATPVVYSPETVGNLSKYSALALQSEAPKVTFSLMNKLALAVAAEGVADSAHYDTVPTTYNGNSVGGRTYTVTVTNKDGQLAPEGSTAYVAFEDGNISGDVYFSTGTQDFAKVTTGSVKAITVGKEGKATFRIAGKGATTFVKPTVFLNTAGTVSPVALDKTDVQTVADVTYFKVAVVKNAVLSVRDKAGKVITSTTAGTDAYFTYQSVDQNGFAYKPDNSSYELAFDVTSTFGNAIVKYESGVLLNATQNLGNTKTYKVTSNSTGKAVVRVTTTSPDTVSVNVTGASGILPTQTATVSFTKSSAVDVATGKVISVNEDNETFVIQNAATGKAYTLSYSEDDVTGTQIAGEAVEYDIFAEELTRNDDVIATKTADGKYVLNIKTNTSDSSVTVTSQEALNHLIANTSDSTLAVNVNIASGGLSINTNKTITLNLTGTVTGDLTVNAPNAHINNTATVSGDVNLVDVASSSFENKSGGVISGDVVITDNNARFKNSGDLTGKVFIEKNAATIKLEGDDLEVVVGDDVESLTLDVSGSGTTITAEAGTVIKDSTGADVEFNKETGFGTTGTVTLTSSPSEFVDGNPQATVKVTDRDLNKSATVQEEVTVTYTLANGTSKTLKLTETSANSVEFVGTVNIDAAGDLVVTYTDKLTATGEEEAIKGTKTFFASEAAKELIVYINSVEGESSDMVDEVEKLELTAFNSLDQVNKIEVAKLFIVERGAYNADTPIKNGYKTLDEIKFKLTAAITAYNKLLADVNNASTDAALKTALANIYVANGGSADSATNEVVTKVKAGKPQAGYVSVTQIIEAISAQ